MKIDKVYTRACSCGFGIVRVRFVVGHPNGTWTQHAATISVPSCYFDERDADDCILSCGVAALRLDDVVWTSLVNYDFID